MGSNESQNCIYYDMYSSLAIVALSAQPPGVNELCVCRIRDKEFREVL